MADESVPVPETEPLNLEEDLKKLEDEINTLKQARNLKLKSTKRIVFRSFLRKSSRLPN